MITIVYSAEQAMGLLKEVAIDTTGWQSILGGNQKLYTVPEDFPIKEYDFPKDSLYRFDEWGSDDDGNKIVRVWSKW